MKLHPMRNAHVGRSVLRGRIMSEIFSSANGQRVLRECRAALELSVNSDEESRKLVLARYAIELDIVAAELEDLLMWKESKP
jgi:hypothetical protein